MSKVSLKMKLGAGFGLLLVILVAMGVISYTSVQKLRDLSDISDQKANGRFLSTSIASLINNQKSEYRAFLLDSQETQMTGYAADSQIIAEDFGKLEGTLSTDKGRELVSHLRQTLDDYHQVIERAVRLHRAGKQREAIAAMDDPKSDAIRADLKKTVADLIEAQDKLKTAAREEQAATGSRTTTLVLSLAICGVIVGLLVAVIITRSITGAISAMVGLIQEIAANNLATDDMEINSQDEIGKAGAALNGMKNNLREMIQSIAGTAEHVAAPAKRSPLPPPSSRRGRRRKRTRPRRLPPPCRRCPPPYCRFRRTPSKAAEASRRAAETARHGGSIVDETLTKMRVIADSVSGTARKMEELGKSSDQIGHIIGVIDEIADQTNLLALNAAIEAARAGEQGRGFAVVADEVRKLAERTTTATKEIAQMIKNIQDETKTAVTAMEAGNKQVEEGVKSTAQAGDSLKEIIHMSEEVGEMITHIATAATEQSSASEEINNNMEQIAKLVRESAVGAQQSAKACQDLSGLALDLQKMVSNFKLDDGNGHGREPRHGKSAMQSRTEESYKAAAAAR